MTTMSPDSRTRSLARTPRVEHVDAKRRQGTAGVLPEEDPTLRGWQPRAKVYRDPSKRAGAIARLRGLAWLLDTSIRVPHTNFKIGLDPIIGLIPGIGDVLGAILSALIVREAWRLGVPKRMAARMLFNVLVELVVGTVPLIGDLFDAAWKANVRNLKLMGIWKDGVAPINDPRARNDPRSRP